MARWTLETGRAIAELEALDGGNGIDVGCPTTVDLTRNGYLEQEYVASGQAASFAPKSPLGRNGRWTFEEAGVAEYRTRVLVRRPIDPADVSGSVVVEWLNVSGGYDAAVVWANTSEELIRRRHVWVGVSAQVTGVSGGPVLASPLPDATSVGLRGKDPARYGSLSHPGDGYAFDIYTQVGRALRTGGEVLANVAPDRLLAVGQSQSAAALVTYLNGVQPRTHAFDGFLVHSRGGSPLPLAGPGRAADLAGPELDPTTIIRTDTTVPVVNVQTEGDLFAPLHAHGARQADNRSLRLWEVAGTAHADARMLGGDPNRIPCGAPVNTAPMYLVVMAALRALDIWVGAGIAPPRAPRISTSDRDPVCIVRDEDGIACGGIRLPAVDVPVDVLSSVPGPGARSMPFCVIFGSTTPLGRDRIAARYRSREDYVRQYDAAIDRVIKAGFVLPEDRRGLMALRRVEAVELG